MHVYSVKYRDGSGVDVEDDALRVTLASGETEMLPCSVELLRFTREGWSRVLIGGIREAAGAWALDARRRGVELPAIDGFVCPNVAAIMAAIVSSRGARKGRLLESRPPRNRGGRAYYVWRMARYHGGRDPRMPVCAGWELDRGEPWVPALDVIVDIVAKTSFGSNMAAAERWRGLLG